MKRIHTEKGQALVLIALAAIVLFAFAALAIDGSMLFSDRRHAQNAADTSAVAAALARTRGQDFSAIALARAASNGYDNSINDVVLVTTLETPSGACSSTGKDITVTIISTVNMTLARVIGRSQMTNTVAATSRSCDLDVAGGVPLYNGNAVMSLNTDSCNGRPTKNLYVGGSGQLQIWAAGMGSASSDGGCVDFSGGNTQVHKEDPICPTGVTTAAATIPNNNLNKLYNPDHCGNFVVTGAAVAPPPSDLNISCGATNATKSGSTLTPGNWNTSSISPGSISTLQAGTYCVTGSIHLTGGSLNGNGVTLVMLNGSFKMTGQSQMNIKAPTSNNDSFGNYTKGLLIYYPPGNSSDLNMEGESNATLRGTVLAQNSNCYFAGSGQIQKAKLQFICDTFQINGNGQGELVWDSSVLFAPTTVTNPTISLLR
jgi:Flp pilus assembly protein TadG